MEEADVIPFAPTRHKDVAGNTGQDSEDEIIPGSDDEVRPRAVRKRLYTSLMSQMEALSQLHPQYVLQVCLGCSCRSVWGIECTRGT